MGIRLTTGESKTALFDSVSGFAFGPTFDSDDEAEAFQQFAERATHGQDLRAMHDSMLRGLYYTFLRDVWADHA